MKDRSYSFITIVCIPISKLFLDIVSRQYELIPLRRYENVACDFDVSPCSDGNFSILRVARVVYESLKFTLNIFSSLCSFLSS
jgi:hypothetical protein